MIRKLQSVAIYPASHYVTTSDRMEIAVRDIRDELKERLEFFRAENRLLEAQRLEQRTMYDLELLAEMGFCPGIENYSRHLTGRHAGAGAADAARLLSRRTPSSSSTRAT